MIEAQNTIEDQNTRLKLNEANAMMHVVLLGDSVFDNGALWAEILTFSEQCRLTALRRDQFQLAPGMAP